VVSLAVFVALRSSSSKVREPESSPVPVRAK
jgi:hypothetical protein